MAISLVEFADPTNPLFCPCNFLLSVGIHLMADTGERSWEDSMLAWCIIKFCYMEVMYDRKYGKGSDQARMAAMRRLGCLHHLGGADVDPLGRDILALSDTAHRVARV